MISAPTPKGQRLPQQERSSAARQRVLAAAARVLVAGGLDKFTTARVAEEAGVSPTMVYRRFAGKNELLAAVQADLWDRLNFAIADALANHGTSLGGVLHAFTTALSDVLAASGQVIPALLGSAKAPLTPELASMDAMQRQFLDAAGAHRADIHRTNPTTALKMSFHTMIAAATLRAMTAPQWPDGLTWQQWSTEIADMTTAYLQSHRSLSCE